MAELSHTLQQRTAEFEKQRSQAEEAQRREAESQRLALIAENQSKLRLLEMKAAEEEARHKAAESGLTAMVDELTRTQTQQPAKKSIADKEGVTKEFKEGQQQVSTKSKSSARCARSSLASFCSCA